MPQNWPLLECYLNGECVVRVRFASGKLQIATSKQGLLSTAVDRVVFHASVPGGPTGVLDVVPGDPPIYPGGSTVTLDKPANPDRVDLDLRVRVLIVGGAGGLTRVRAAVVADPSPRIAFLNVDGRSLLPAGGAPWSALTLGNLTRTYSFPLLDAAPPPLLGALGLPARVPFGVAAKFAFEQTAADSNILTPALTYRFALRASEKAAIHLNNLQLDWTAEEVAIAGLVDLAAPDPVYSRLPGLAKQTLWLQPGELNAPGSVGVGKWLVELTGFPSRAVVSAWNEYVVVPYLRALWTLQAGQPVTGLPWLTQVDYLDLNQIPAPPHTQGRDLSATLSGRLRWEIALLVLDGVHGEFPLTEASFTTTSGFAPVGRLGVSLAWLRPMEAATTTGQGTPRLPIIASLSGFLTHDGSPVVLMGWIQPVSVQPETTYAFAFDIRWFLTPTANGKGSHSTAPSDQANPVSDADHCQHVRIGALDLVLPPPPPDDSTMRPPTVLDPLFPPSPTPLWPRNRYPRTRNAGRPPDLVYSVLPPFDNPDQPQIIPDARYRVSLNPILAGPRHYSTALAVNLTTTIPVLAVAPGGQDPRSDEVFLGSAAPGEVNAILGDSQLSSAFTREEPLLVGDHRTKVRSDLMPSLYLELATQSQSTSSATESIALKLNAQVRADVFAELNRQRELLVLDRQPFFVGKLRVPTVPASLNPEAKEVAFWDAANALGFRWRIRTDNPQFMLELPPQVIGEQLEKTKPDIPDSSSAPIDFRFSPPAALQLRASDVDSQFVVVCWNLRRIFEGDELVSPQLTAAELELLYGVALRVRVPALRVTETQTLQGKLPGQFPDQLAWNGLPAQGEAYTATQDAWADTYGRLLSRLGILQPWLIVDEPELTLSDPQQVRYQLRPTSDVRYPFGDYPPPGSNIPKGDLAGGFAWAFPFSSVYAQIWARPVSNVGTLSRPYLSALGGWGHQKGQFCDGTISLIADTAMGRTSFYSLEIIGRIGVFWNRAKHVIIYQRAVAPSEQFAAEQDQQLGRPLLRKVEEYIEILVPTARFGNASATNLERRARGCLLGIQFKTLRIHVDSAWGGDVYDRKHVAIGYQIPLWNAKASQDLLDVYPLPHVLFELAADPAAGFSSFFRDVIDVAKLRFFHSSRTQDGGDTDEWPSFEGIDFLLKPAPKPDKEGTDFTSQHGKPQLRDDMPFAPPAKIADGFEQFTWEIATDDVKAHLTVDRPGKVVSTVIQNVLATRPIPATIPTLDETPDYQLHTSDVLEEGKQLTDPSTTQSFVTGLNNNLNDISRLLAPGPQSGLKDKVTKIVVQLQSSLRSALDNFAPPYLDRLNAFRSALMQGSFPALGEVRDLLVSFQKSIEPPSLDACRQVLLNAATQLARGLSSAGGAVFQDFESSRLSLQNLADQLGGYLQSQQADWDNISVSIKQLLNDGVSDVTRFQTGVSAILSRAITTARAVSNGMQSLWNSAGIHPRVPPSVATLQSTLDQAIDAFNTSMKTAIANLTSLDPTPLITSLNTAKTNFVNALTGPLTTATNDVNGFLNTLNSNLTVTAAQLSLPKFLAAIINSDPPTPPLATAWYQDALTKLNNASDKRASAIDSLSKICANGALNGLVTTALTTAGIDLATKLNNLLGPAKNAATDLADALNNPVVPLLAELATNPLATAPDVAHFAAVLAGVHFPPATDAVFSNALPLLKQLVILPGPEEIAHVGDQAVRLLRTFGDVPDVPALTFNADQLGYYFDALEDVVDTTPVLSLIARPVPGIAEFAEDKLKALGVRLPTRGLLDGLVPSLDDFTPDLSDMFPDFAGLKLDKLFPALAIPDDLKDNIKISHGLDQQTLRAWLKADVAFDSKGPTEIFSFGPLTLTVIDPHFEAHVSLSADATGHVVKTTTGLIKADWDLNVASLDIVTLVATQLTFDQSGRINVDIKPQNIRLNGLLELISDAVDQVSGDSDGGLSYNLVQEGGFPVGVQILLDIVLPPIQEGTTGISNLRLTTAFEIVSAPEFALGVKFGLGLPEQPFTITVFILGGAGAVNLGARYLPFSGRLSADVAITAAASASLAIDIGPISGMVALYLGFTADFHRDLIGGDGRDNKLVLTAFIELLGEVDVLDIITVQIEVRLSLTYDQGVLTGEGSVSISVQICWCFSIDVSTDITLRFGGSGGRQTSQASHSSVTGPSPRALPSRAASAAAPATPPVDVREAAAECVAMYDLS